MDPLTADAAAVTSIIGGTGTVLRFLPDHFKKYGVVVSCALGVLYALALRPPAGEHWTSLVARGLMQGLSASGGYAGMKSMMDRN
jgi:hypothetical protein